MEAADIPPPDIATLISPIVGEIDDGLARLEKQFPRNPEAEKSADGLRKQVRLLGDQLRERFSVTDVWWIAGHIILEAKEAIDALGYANQCIRSLLYTVSKSSCKIVLRDSINVTQGIIDLNDAAKKIERIINLGGPIPPWSPERTARLAQRMPHPLPMHYSRFEGGYCPLRSSDRSFVVIVDASANMFSHYAEHTRFSRAGMFYYREVVSVAPLAKVRLYFANSFSGVAQMPIYLDYDRTLSQFAAYRLEGRLLLADFFRDACTANTNKRPKYLIILGRPPDDGEALWNIFPVLKIKYPMFSVTLRQIGDNAAAASFIRKMVFAHPEYID